MADEQLRIVIDALNKASDDITKVKKELGSLDDTTKKVDKSSKNFGQTWAGVLTGINSGIMIAQQAAAALKKIYDTAREGAALEYAETKFDNLASSINTTADALLYDLHDATRGMYSDAQLIQSAGDFMSLGLAKTHDEVVRLSTVASALDMNMNQLVLTLTNKTTMRFDALGVSTDGFSKRLKALEDQGYSTDEAFTEAFLQQAEAQIAKVGEAADEDIGTFKRLEAGAANLKDEFRRVSEKAVIPLVEDLADFVSTLDDLSKKISGVEDTQFFKFFWDLNAAISPVYFLLQNFDDVVDMVGNTSIPDMIISLLRGNDALSWMADLLDGVVNGYEELYNLLTGGGKQAIDDTGEALAAAGLDAGYYADQAEIAAAKSGALAGSFDDVNNSVIPVNIAMKEYNRQLLFVIASEGMTSDEAFAVAEAMGLVEEDTVGAYTAIKDLREEYESGQISLDTYATTANKLADGLDRLHDVDVTVRTTYEEVYNRGFSSGYLPNVRETRAVGGNVMAENDYIWQEYRGGEAFVPSQDGYVLSRADAAAALAGGGGKQVVNNYNLTMPTSNSPSDVAMAFEIMRVFGS
jgi:hypothetical protein